MRDELLVALDEGAFMPERAHATDAGLDIRYPLTMLGAKNCAVRIRPHGDAVFRTGVHVRLPVGTCGLLMSKSGLNVNHRVTSTGLIDEGYSGEIMVRLYNHGEEPYDVHPGDKITQLVIVPCRYYEPVRVESVEGGERGDAGFGSTGR